MDIATLKIVSGGQTGADRAALDWPIAQICLWFCTADALGLFSCPRVSLGKNSEPAIPFDLIQA